MIKELAIATGNKELAGLASKQPRSVGLTDISLAPLLASSIKPPFIYVSQSKDGAHHAVSVLQNCGLNVLGVAHTPEPPLFTEKPSPDPLATAIHKFMSGGVDAVVLYAPLLRQLLPQISATPLELNVGMKISRAAVIKHLESCGYQYDVRGDVIDITYEGIVARVIFYGNLIEAIQGRKSLKLTPTAPSEFVTPAQAESALQKIKPAHENTHKIIEKIKLSIERDPRTPGGRWLAPFLFEMMPVTAILKDTLFVYEQGHQLWEYLMDYADTEQLKYQSLLEGGMLLPEHMPVKGVAAPKKILPISTQGEAELSLTTLPIPNFYNAFSALVPDILRNAQANKTIIVFSGTSPALANYLLERNIDFEFATINKIKEGKINLLKTSLGLSFELPKERTVIYSVTEQPITRESTTRKINETIFTYPTIGDVVVHEFHGLGRFLGVQELEIGAGVREYITLQYDGGAIVYVPLDQTQMLTNYVGEPTRLNRIGGQDFTAVKQRLRRRLAELSHKLIKLYSKRQRVSANKYPIDPKLVDDFVAAFPYEYTTDQKSALADIMNDMDGDKIVDRLICGDVGVGKTEVALTAIFRAVMCGHQVALLCPTTILSEQHYSVIKKRLGAFGARVEVLNRFKSDKETQEILSALEHGEVDILIGTHRILSADVRFKNLSLLVLDEEQRFGVTHKEKIKHLKHNVDVLTLSATPIPRTLNMALLGIRDISTINTAPSTRKNILTFITEFSDELLTEAISRELHRGGQTLVLYNRVETIDTFAYRLGKFTNARIAIAHGQMRESELESVIKRLYNQEIDVLVCSTIIENGIDIATANTLVV
ncbi:MAG: DEAD/DEAH box helicase, partial [Firmicutes bacterium]|nr:DEAD/DEAH box helicase [Bacillota bacterium]